MLREGAAESHTLPQLRILADKRFSVGSRSFGTRPVFSPCPDAVCWAQEASSHLDHKRYESCYYQEYPDGLHALIVCCIHAA